MIAQGYGGPGKFQTTSWSLIVAAAQQGTASADAALAELCQLYWYPVYVFVRRRGYSKDDTSDLTQEFFARLLEKNYLKDADPVRGRFRSFLLASVCHFLANEWNRERAQKRGGGALPIALDMNAAEDRYTVEPASQETPEKLYERHYALSLLDQVQASMRLKYIQNKQIDRFEKLAPLLTGGQYPPIRGNRTPVEYHRGVGETSSASFPEGIPGIAPPEDRRNRGQPGRCR